MLRMARLIRLAVLFLIAADVHLATCEDAPSPAPLLPTRLPSALRAHMDEGWVPDSRPKRRSLLAGLL